MTQQQVEKRKELQRLVKAWEETLVEIFLYKLNIYDDLTDAQKDEIDECRIYIEDFRRELAELEQEMLNGTIEEYLKNRLPGQE